MKGVSVNTLWPTTLVKIVNPDHTKIKKNLLSFFDKYIKKNTTEYKSGNAGENFLVYESLHNLQKEDDKSCKELMTFISQSFLTASNIANKKDLEKVINPIFDVQINGAWFMKYKKGGFVLPHAHGSCSWSCVYYVQVDGNIKDKQGSTYFMKPTTKNSTNDFGSRHNAYENVRYKPEEGSVILWPGHINHGSIPYYGDINRIVVSANALINLVK